MDNEGDHNTVGPLADGYDGDSYDTDGYDVVVIGGGAAGLNGALMLARSRRSVAVIDAGAPRNAPAEAVHGMLGHDGIAPTDLLARGRAEVRGYGGHVISAVVDSAARDGDRFVVRLSDGRDLTARRLLLATGVADELPDVPGLAEQWGHGVVHCPYCHGWEVRDRAIGVLASSSRATHQALMFSQLTDDVVYFANGTRLTDEQLEELGARDITVVDGIVSAVEIMDHTITGVRLADGRVIDREVMAVQTRTAAHATFLSGLGIVPVEHPAGVGTYIPADPVGRTSADGVWAAGNVADPMLQVGASAAAGAMAGAVINADLITEDTRAAVAARRVAAGQELMDVNSCS